MQIAPISQEELIFTAQSKIPAHRFENYSFLTSHLGHSAPDLIQYSNQNDVKTLDDGCWKSALMFIDPDEDLKPKDDNLIQEKPNFNQLNGK